MSSLSSIAGLNSSGINFAGLASGIDTNSVIQGLMSIQQAQVARLKRDQDQVVLQQTTFQAIQTGLADLQGRASELARTFNGVFDAKQATTSNKDLATAAASASAVPGTYSLRVTSLAQAQQVASQGFDDLSSVINQGTLQIKVGTGATTTVTIDSTNNTLQGLANAINGSGADVTASIVNDGSDGRTQPYRLLLTSKKAGAANNITLTNNLTTGSAIKPELHGTTINEAVKSASFTGTSTPSANVGAGTYTGTKNNTYQFKVETGGTVGGGAVTLSFTDSLGNSGTVNVGAGEADTFKTVGSLGLQIKLSAGTLVAGETFSVDAFVPNVQTASDAAIQLGSGNGALTLASSTNTVEGVIGGVTLNLLAADATKEVTVTVNSDTAATRKALDGFVKAYNDLADFVNSRSGFDAKTNKAGILLGNGFASDTLDQVTRVLSDTVAGVNTKASRLSTIGITLDEKGKLRVDGAKLDKALNGQLTGVTINDLRRLFALDGSSTNSSIQFISTSSKTKANNVAFQVNVTAVAKQAGITTANTLAAAPITIGPGNDSLTISVDGKTSNTITLAANSYTAVTLAQELQGKINADTNLLGSKVAVSVENNKLKITSQVYGSLSKVTIGSGNALATLGFAGTETSTGQDVAGTFSVNGGPAEAAAGVGQFLTGNSGNANSDGLQVRATLTESQLIAGNEGTVTTTQGLASKLNDVLNRFLDPVTGRLKTINDTFQQTVDDIQERIDRQNALIVERQQALVIQFAAMERAVSQLKSSSNFLTGQLAGIAPIRA